MAEHTGSRLPIYKDLPPLIPYFVMRREPWDKLVAGMVDAEASQDGQRVLVISGMGGCGKTQLVIRFTTEHRSRCVHTYLIPGRI